MDQDAPQKPIDRGEKGYDPSTVERERERVRFFLGESALRIASTIAQSMQSLIFFPWRVFNGHVDKRWWTVLRAELPRKGGEGVRERECGAGTKRKEIDDIGVWLTGC